MNKIQLLVAAITLSIAGSFLALAQQPAQAPPQPMSFFIASAGSGHGANLGGLAGADKLCQTLATAAGSTKTFHAYLSTQGPNAVNARDRIGNGPWYNAKGEKIANNLAITPAATGRARRPALPSSDILTAAAPTISHGTPRTRAGVAARKIW